MKRLLCVTLLSSLLVGQSQASDRPLLEGAAYAAAGLTATAIGAYIGHRLQSGDNESGYQLSTGYFGPLFSPLELATEASKPQSIIGGLVGWAAAFAVKEYFTNSTASRIGMATGLAGLAAATTLTTLGYSFAIMNACK